jgi:hypothetical protein
MFQTPIEGRMFQTQIERRMLLLPNVTLRNLFFKPQIPPERMLLIQLPNVPKYLGVMRQVLRKCSQPGIFIMATTAGLIRKCQM